MTSLQPAHSTNRLIHEKSPYLLQHAQNPVDWYPWGPEAFAKARKENKPILVSIGYSTCHWCHVMEKESYEDPQTAALMNKYLVNIKVDREERPDIDKIYMAAVSAMTGSAGWPLNVFLTPDLKPFFGGTYFPPTPRWGQPAWRDVVRHIGASWADPKEREGLLATGNQMAEALKHYVAAAHESTDADGAWLKGAFDGFTASFDSSRGGFGPAPKFPMPVYQNFLFDFYARTRHEKPVAQHEQALTMALTTLRAMARGGIYDQLGGGFARYSTDGDWHVPHFEKMLYDNAQLALNFLTAYQITRAADLRQTLEETLAYIRRDMTHPEGVLQTTGERPPERLAGGFYSAEDADSLPASGAPEKKEGAFYVWDKKTVQNVLTAPEADVFCFRYGVREGGNAKQDPHGEFTGQNILYIAHPIAETARQFHVSEADAENLLASGRQKLFAARLKRPRPHLDDKIISGWNGLMISAYAQAAQVLNNPEDLAAAQRCAQFLHAHLYDATTHTLYRSWRDGAHAAPAIADDYAFVAQGLLDLYETDFNTLWLAWAEDLMDQMLQRFYDADRGGFYMTAIDQDAHLLLRVKEDTDNVEPAASSIAALNLLRLNQMTDRADFAQAAAKTLKAYGSVMRDQPRALAQMLVALDFSLTPPRQIVIAGDLAQAETQKLLAVVHAEYIPVKTVLLADGKENQAWLAKRLPQVAGMKPLHGKAAAYVCSGHTCSEPTSDPAELKRLLSR